MSERNDEHSRHDRYRQDTTKHEAPIGRHKGEVGQVPAPPKNVSTARTHPRAVSESLAAAP